MLTPDYLDTIADPIIELFSKLQEEILSDIVRRVAKTGKVTATAEWQIIKAQESGMLLNDIQEYMQKTLGLSATELQELFEQATIEDLTGHFKKADIVKLLKRDTTMYQSLLAGLEKTQGSLVNLTMSTAESYQTLFFSACDDAYMKIQSGAFDYNSAIVEATNTMLDNSEPVVRYPSGWRNSVDVAVRRAVLTGINQTMGQVQMDLAEELGLDYVDVSAHMGARPDHAVWQGKRYCISGKDPDYPKFEDATGYGTGAGLCGWNCRHTFFPTTKNAPAYYTDSELEAIKNAKVTYNGQEIGYYDATQIQRKYEYQCRNLRKELVALDELPGSPEKTAVFERKSATLKQREAQYKDFSRQTGLLTQTERMRTYGYNKALSQKVGKASREYLEGHKEIKPLTVVSQPKPKPLKPNKPAFVMSYDATDYKDTVLYKKWGKDFAQGVLDKVKDAPDSYKKLFNEYVFDMPAKQNKKEAFWNGFSYSIDKATNLTGRFFWTGERMDNPFSVFFHETGHGIDNTHRKTLYMKLGQKAKSPTELYASSAYKNGLLQQTLTKELTTVYEKYAMGKYGDPTWTKSVYKEFIDDVKASPDFTKLAYADISDMYEAIFPTYAYPFNFGHGGTKYWGWGNNTPIHIKKQSTEAFAEMTEAMLVNPDALKVIQKYAPESYKIYLEILEEMANEL